MEKKTTREKFQVETLKLFQQKGFKATTMRDIAKRLNIEAASIYNYVNSKQELLDRFLFDIANKFHQGITNIEGSSYSPLEKIKAIVGLNVRLTVENPYQVALLVSEWKQLKEPRLQEFIQNRTDYESKFRNVIKAGMDVGELRPMDLEIATFSILSSIRWLFSWYTPEKANINPIELEKQMIDFILKGIQS